MAAFGSKRYFFGTLRVPTASVFQRKSKVCTPHFVKLMVLIFGASEEFFLRSQSSSLTSFSTATTCISTTFFNSSKPTERSSMGEVLSSSLLHCCKRSEIFSGIFGSQSFRKNTFPLLLCRREGSA